jgi:hypothetical protein
MLIAVNENLENIYASASIFNRKGGSIKSLFKRVVEFTNANSLESNREAE